MTIIKYAPELKEQAIRAIRELGLTQAQASEKFGVHSKTISRWVRQHVEAGGISSGNATTQSRSHITEIAKLRRELDNAYRVIGKLTTSTDRPKG